MSALLDTSVFAGHWPFRALPATTPGELKARLAAGGVTQAWIAPLDAVFYADPHEANRALAASVQGDSFYVFVGALNPTLPAWRRDAEECLDKLGARALKVFPNYHGYALTDARAAELAELCARRNVPLCVQLRMQDERGHHPLVKVPGVPLADVKALHERVPAARLLACAAYVKEMKELQGLPNLWAEISHAEWELSLASALERCAPEYLVYGSHAPLHYPEAEVAKLAVPEVEFPAATLEAVRAGNAQRLLGS